ncbi:hypothetical protein KJ628_04485 [Patescibacteria group bacterium]|nr:hypothetical protein [Patescibacteria group bacterium]
MTMKKSKNRLIPLVGVLFILLILLFIGVLRVKGAKERYCLAQTHMQFPITTQMEGDKWDYFTGCFDKLSFKDSVRLLLSDQSAELKKATEISELLAVMEKNPNKDSQVYKEAREKFCLLTARSAEEREQAVSNIQKFLGSSDMPVEFLCSRFNGKPDDSGTDYTSPASEHYLAGGFGFTVDPNANYIVEVGEDERRWGTNDDDSRWFDLQPEYDNTPRYTTADVIRPVAEQFMKDHQDILGVDISQMIYEFQGTKPGNFFVRWVDYENPHTEEFEQCGDTDQTLETAYQRDDGVWCASIKNTRYPTVSLTITQGGQVIVYDNDGWEIEKL